MFNFDADVDIQCYCWLCSRSIDSIGFVSIGTLENCSGIALILHWFCGTSQLLLDCSGTALKLL